MNFWHFPATALASHETRGMSERIAGSAGTGQQIPDARIEQVDAG
jgi:hypothetical protein